MRAIFKIWFVSKHFPKQVICHSILFLPLNTLEFQSLISSPFWKGVYKFFYFLRTKVKVVYNTILIHALGLKGTKKNGKEEENNKNIVCAHNFFFSLH